jgi:hypothetical protein
MTDWDIQPRADSCVACGRPFVEKQPYHTLLSVEGGGYVRRDLCGECFSGANRQGVLSYWQGQYRQPPAPVREPIRRETAESLLRRLLASAEPVHAAARYILAVMLERKRVLRHRDTVGDGQGGELLVYEHAGTGESIVVPDPGLRLDQIEQVQREVAALLEAGGENVEAGRRTDPASAETAG